jgi:hypothetical protein
VSIQDSRISVNSGGHFPAAFSAFSAVIRALIHAAQFAASFFACLADGGAFATDGSVKI